MARQFGIISSASGLSSIVITSFNKAENADIAEARNSQGLVTDLKAYSKSETISVKGYLDAASCSVTAGSTLTIGSKSYVVESVTVNETNTGYTEVDISAKTADSATVAAYSSDTTTT